MAREEDNTEHLFLMECHVSELHFHSPETFDEPNTGTRQKVCITISFLHFAELLLCDETSEERMSGKSFLFALSKQTLSRYATNTVDPNSFVVGLKVYRADLNSEGHTHSPLGQTKIPLGEKFSDMSRTVIFGSMMPPTTFSIDMKCRLKNRNETEIGTLQTSLRMSCFGKMIVTHIHMAPSGTERELPRELMRKITALTERHIAAGPTAAAEEGKYSKNLAEPNALATSTPNISYEEFQEKIKEREQLLEMKGKDWGDVLGYPLMDLGEPVRSETNVAEMQSGEEVEESSYEEITAKVNGHLLFFKVLKGAKREKRGGAADAEQSGAPILRPPTKGMEVQNDCNECIKERDMKSDKKTGKLGKNVFPSNEGDDRGINSGRKVLTPKEKAKKLFRNEEVAIAGSKTPITQCMLEKMKEAQEARETNEGDKSAAVSATKEVFCLKVGKKTDSAGIMRPKVILKIIAPKTKEEIEEEDELAELEEKRLEKMEAKKKLKEFVTKETQYCEADVGEEKAPDQVQKKGKKKAAGKSKKGKKP
ncbi:hypothetical protein J437_LFUL012053 [Ladona fulva]|uniref:Uncharacterized protein n=1 Tax=Ladona fulva TaxID=123851 RepID=A0A8K0KBC4_LADFU|nr:hypothetical protein J437_LFUL012053 [Ladona fulva]